MSITERLLGGRAVSEWLSAATPKPDPNFDPTTVTPTWVGFAVTFLIAVATVLLIMDMVRRVRRVRYRSEVLEKLEAERGENATSTETPHAPDER